MAAPKATRGRERGIDTFYGNATSDSQFEIFLKYAVV
jgi:hypothetical protein